MTRFDRPRQTEAAENEDVERDQEDSVVFGQRQ